MTHDYGERMSLMLDGRLSARERADLEAHLAACTECRARWAAFQQVDRVLANAAQVVPAPGFAMRFAARLAHEQAQPARRFVRPSPLAGRGRLLAGLGVFAAGVTALALLIVPTLIAVWFGINNLVEGAPSLFVSFTTIVARWLVTLSALGEAGRSIFSVLTESGGPVLIGYALILVLIIAAWVTVVTSLSRRRNTTTLPVLAWL